MTKQIRISAASIILYQVLIAAGILLLVAMPGCSSVSQDAKVVLKTAADSAKENAIAFKLLSVFLVASDAKEEPFIRKYVQVHTDGLGLHAMALADFSHAADLGALKDSSRRQLTEMAVTARARAEVFIQMRAHLALKAGSVDPTQWLAYMAQHETGLKNLASMLEVLAERLKEDKGGE